MKLYVEISLFYNTQSIVKRKKNIHMGGWSNFGRISFGSSWCPRRYGLCVYWNGFVTPVNNQEQWY